MKGMHKYTLGTTHVPKICNTTAILLLQFMVHVMLRISHDKREYFSINTF
jgi:hypothetical protein